MNSLSIKISIKNKRILRRSEKQKFLNTTWWKSFKQPTRKLGLVHEVVEPSAINRLHASPHCGSGRLRVTKRERIPLRRLLSSSPRLQLQGLEGYLRERGTYNTYADPWNCPQGRVTFDFRRKLRKTPLQFLNAA